MYLSKVILKWPACRNPYQWHRSIWHLFPGRKENKRDYQFACLRTSTEKDISILLLSKEKPNQLRTSEIEFLDEGKSLADLSFCHLPE
jgi:CRISPR system Cascade subunit CasE